MWLGGGQRGCSSGLSDTVRHGELLEHLCSGRLGGLRRKWQQLRLQPSGSYDAGGGTRGSNVGGGIGDWATSSGTGSGDVCGGYEVVEDPRCT